MNRENSKSGPTNYHCLSVFTIVIVTRIIWHYLAGYTADDAFITFRYAENIASGNGFVYNSFQRVLGTTTPLYTLLLTIPAMLSVSLITASMIFNSVSSGLTAVLLYRTSHRLSFGSLSLLPVALYVFFPRILATDTGGMETAFFTLLVTTSLYFLFINKTSPSLLMASLAVLTRPEGFFILAIVLLIKFRERFFQTLKLAIIPIVLILPWTIFANSYFGSPIPHSIPAKLALYSQFGTMSTWENLSFLLGLHNPLGYVVTIGWLAGVLHLWKTKRFGSAENAWIVVVLVFLSLSRTHLFLWYVTPVYPYVLLFVAASGKWILDSFSFLKTKVMLDSITVLAVIVVVLGFASLQSAQSFKARQHVLNTVHKSIGIYLHDNMAEREIVAAEDIGYIGYYSQAWVLDRDGLVSPEALLYNLSGDYYSVIHDYRPEWVVADPGSPISGFVLDSIFTEAYVRDTAFASDDIEYIIFKKK